MHVLLREFKRRANEQIDFDQILSLAKENARLKKENVELQKQLSLTKDELQEKTELLTLKGVFAVKVRFSNSRD